VLTAGMLIVAYLLGSVPSGYLLVRAARGLDVRDHGSHNVGAINVARVAGLPLGLVTVLADAGKAAAIVAASAGLGRPAWVVAGAAFLVMVGHAFSLWFLLQDRRVSEGKSVACALGVLVGLAGIHALPWPSALAPVGVWGAGLLAPRALTGRWYCISPATMAAAASIPFAVQAAHPAAPYGWLGVAMAALILARHRENVRRLWVGTEPRLGTFSPGQIG